MLLKTVRIPLSSQKERIGNTYGFRRHFMALYSVNNTLIPGTYKYKETRKNISQEIYVCRELLKIERKLATHHKFSNHLRLITDLTTIFSMKIRKDLKEFEIKNFLGTLKKLNQQLMKLFEEFYNKRKNKQRFKNSLLPLNISI